jgi:uncharacterized cupredoxin-like copper-binding protein
VLLAVLGCVVGVSAGCGGEASRSAPLVGVSERDYRIKAPHQLHAGEVRLRLQNEGPDTHELIVVRQIAGQELPLRSDGLTVDEEALEQRTAATVEAVAPGRTRDDVVTLKPGRYLLFCNMAGHYLGGMHTTLVVR